MTMSDRPGRRPAGNGTTRTRRRRHLAALTLLVAAVSAMIPAQAALAGGNGPQPFVRARAEAAAKAAYAQAFTGPRPGDTELPRGDTHRRCDHERHRLHRPAARGTSFPHRLPGRDRLRGAER
ncbi:exported hypothetical protein [Parafrankia sp. Ea1.12]|nr:exported hypothetical protein [Parafrankia sp. Ea1.12]